MRKRRSFNPFEPGNAPLPRLIAQLGFELDGPLAIAFGCCAPPASLAHNNDPWSVFSLVYPVICQD
jgi:hypothetical protein